MSSEDNWLKTEISLLKKAAASISSTVDKNERWKQIAKQLPGRSKKECYDKYKDLKLKAKRKAHRDEPQYDDVGAPNDGNGRHHGHKYTDDHDDGDFQGHRKERSNDNIDVRPLGKKRSSHRLVRKNSWGEREDIPERAAGSGSGDHHHGHHHHHGDHSHKNKTKDRYHKHHHGHHKGNQHHSGGDGGGGAKGTGTNTWEDGVEDIQLGVVGLSISPKKHNSLLNDNSQAKVSHWGTDEGVTDVKAFHGGYSNDNDDGDDVESLGGTTSQHRSHHKNKARDKRGGAGSATGDIRDIEEEDLFAEDYEIDPESKEEMGGGGSGGGRAKNKGKLRSSFDDSGLVVEDCDDFDHEFDDNNAGHNDDGFDNDFGDGFGGGGGGASRGGRGNTRSGGGGDRSRGGAGAYTEGDEVRPITARDIKHLRMVLHGDSQPNGQFPSSWRYQGFPYLTQAKVEKYSRRDASARTRKLYGTGTTSKYGHGHGHGHGRGMGGGDGDDEEEDADVAIPGFDLGFGLVQRDGGPCGAIAVTQAFVLRWLIHGNRPPPYHHAVPASASTNNASAGNAGGSGGIGGGSSTNTPYNCALAGINSSPDVRQASNGTEAPPDPPTAISSSSGASSFTASRRSHRGKWWWWDPSPLAQEEALVYALANMLLRAAAAPEPVPAVLTGSQRARRRAGGGADLSRPVVLALPSRSGGGGVAIRNGDGVTEKLQLHIFYRDSSSGGNGSSIYGSSDVAAQKLCGVIRHHLGLFLESKGPGVILLVYSCILSRGIDNCRADMGLKPLREDKDRDGGGGSDVEENKKGGIDDFGVGGSSLLAEHGYAGQELVNLMLTGRATGHLFDNHRKIEDMSGSSGDSVILQGVADRAEVGFLTLFEAYKYVEVGDNYKNPYYPLWVVCSESHYSVLFLPNYDKKGTLPAYTPPPDDSTTSGSSTSSSSSRKKPAAVRRRSWGENEDEDEYGGSGGSGAVNLDYAGRVDICYYDMLGQQEAAIWLTLDNGRGNEPPDASRAEEEMIPPLDLVIRTKWRRALVDWNGTEPLL